MEKRGRLLLEKTITKSKSEVSLSAFSFLFSELVQYSQGRVNQIQELENRLSVIGYRVGLRFLELIMWREKKCKKRN